MVNRVQQSAVIPHVWEVHELIFLNLVGFFAQEITTWQTILFHSSTPAMCHHDKIFNTQRASGKIRDFLKA